MKETISAGILAGAVAVTAGGGVSIVADGWPEAVLVALAVAGAFGLGIRLADRRVAAIVAVVQSFCEEARVYYRARTDGRNHGTCPDLIVLSGSSAGACSARGAASGGGAAGALAWGAAGRSWGGSTGGGGGGSGSASGGAGGSTVGVSTICTAGATLISGGRISPSASTIPA